MDLTPPVIQSVSPPDGTKQRGQITLSVAATDSVGVTRYVFEYSLDTADQWSEIGAGSSSSVVWDTSLLQDGKTRALGYTRTVGEGGVTYIALGHCHSPETNGQPFVDRSVDPEGKTPLLFRGPWESDAFARLLKNAIEWGAGS